MSIENNKIVNLQDAQVLYNDLRGRVETKADHSPKYGTPVADVADRLVSDKYTEDNTPYLMRKAYDAEFDEECLVGGTVSWNQKLLPFTDSYWGTQKGKKSVDSNGMLTYTATEIGQYGYENQIYHYFTFITGHKYLISMKYKPKYTGALTICGVNPNAPGNNTSVSVTGCTANTWNDIQVLFVGGNRQTTIQFAFNLGLISGYAVGDEVYLKHLQVIDLTQAFGSTIADYINTLETAIAGSGIAKLREWGFFRKPYYEFDAGSLQSVQAGSRVVRGFNAVSSTTLNPVSTAYHSVLGVEAELLPNTAYCISFVGVSGNEIYTNENLFTVQNNITCDGTRQMVVVTTKNEIGKYISSQYENNFGWKIFKNRNTNNVVAGFTDVCINFHLDGERDGEYESYKSASYPFDTSLTLRGLPKLDNGRLYYDGDEYKADGTVTRRYTTEDLGTLNWHVDNDLPSGYKRFYAILPTNALPAKSDTTNGVRTICSKYTVLEQSGTYPATNTGYTVTVDSINNAVIYIYDEAYKSSTTETFATAMSGVYLVYELATPTTESAAPFTPLQEVFPNGTEQFTEWGTRDVEIPVGHKSKYSNNHKTEIDKDIDTLYNNKADAIFKSVSDAAIANFTDGADGMPVKSMVIDIKPVQDLHGQSSPWPAGGNVNQFGVDTVTPATGSTCYGLTVVTDTTNGTISLSGTPSWTVGGNKQFRLFYQNNSYSKSLKAKYFIVSKSANVTSVYEYPLSADNTDALAINIDVTDNNELSLVVKPVVYSGNTSPSAWTPTSNICPITGWTAGNVYRTGKNLLDLSSLRGGNFDVAAAFPHGNASTADYTPVVGGQTYTLSIENLPSSSGRYIRWYDVYKNRIGDDINIYSRTWTGVAPSNARYARFMWYKAASYSSIQDVINEHPQFELGSTATAYEPYIGATYPISWQSKAGTVYGGTLDVTTGVLTVTKASTTVVPNNIANNGHNNGKYLAFYRVTGRAYTVNVISNMFTQNPSDVYYMTVRTNGDGVEFALPYNAIGVSESDDDNSVKLPAAKAWFTNNSVQLVYELATPITYKLDPATITTLLGTNNIFADTGNVNLTYPCDTKTYVDNQISASYRLMELIITANREDAMTATKAYSSGDLLIVNGTLYKATASIANGATLTVGTNVTATTVATELASLA